MSTFQHISTENDPFSFEYSSYLSDKLQDTIIKQGEVMYDKGVTHGSSNIKQSSCEHECHLHAKLIENKIIESSQMVRSKQVGKLDGLTIQLNTLEQKKNTLKNNQKSGFDSQKGILKGVLYIIFGVLILMCEFPLALEVSLEAFNLNNLDVKSGGTELIYLLSSPWDAIKSNWETVFITLGITLCSITFKFLYERIWKLSGFIGKWSRYITIILITLYTLVTIYHIGEMRASVEVNNSAKKGLSAVPTKVTTHSPRTTIILLTLYFPIVSGLCVALGQITISNYIRTQRGKEELDTIVSNIYSLTEETTTLQETLNQQGGSFLIINSYYDIIFNFLLENYVQGFLQGKSIQSNDISTQDLFERVEKDVQSNLNFS